jgi:hypothetical protein
MKPADPSLMNPLVSIFRVVPPQSSACDATGSLVKVFDRAVIRDSSCPWPGNLVGDFLNLEVLHHFDFRGTPSLRDSFVEDTALPITFRLAPQDRQNLSSACD